MVLPALIALAGYGAQAYGSSQRTQAEQNAESAYQRWLNEFNGQDDRANADMSQTLAGAGNEYRADQGQLADSFAPTDRVNSYSTGANAERGHLDQVMALMSSMQPHQILPQGGEGSVFANTTAREAGTNADAYNRLATATSDAAGLNAMNTRDANNVFDFGQKSKSLNSRISRAQQLYSLAQMTRQKALNRASNQHQADTAAAQLAGNGWMLAGGLAGAGAQALGSAQANSGASPSAGMGNAGAADFAQPAAAYDPSFTYHAQA